MMSLRDFENELRTTLAQVERTARPEDGLADRLLAGARGRRRPPHRVDVRRVPRWLPPALAVAATVVLIVVGAVVVHSVQADKPVAPATHRPVPSTPVPATTVPTPSSSPRTSATTSPTHTAKRTASATTPPDAVGPAGVPVPPGFEAVDAQFLDAEHGWALGNVPCSAKPGYCATLARTTDDGQSWRSIPLPSGLTPVDDEGSKPSGGSCGDNGAIYGPCVNRVAFADPVNGYLWSYHALYQTTDGGATWINEHSRNLGVSFSHGNAIRLSPVRDCSAVCASRLWIASIGSTNWHPVSVASIGGDVFGSLGSLFGGGPVVYFYDYDKNGANALYASVDGGASWRLRQQDPCGATGPAPITAGPDGTLAMICGPVVAQRAPNPVMISTDHGATFAARSAPRAGWLGNVVVVVASADDLIAVVNSGASELPIVWSGDGGRTWHEVANVSAGASIDAAFVDSDFGFVVADGGQSLLVSYDGGRSWSKRTVGQ